jgi:hypothetical protein
MKNKIILLFTLFILLNNCGFEPIYSSKNSNFQIKKITILKNNNINKRIQNNLKNYTKNQSNNKFSLQIDSEKKITISTKDKKGDPKLFSMNIIVSVEILEKNKIKNKKIFSESFSYENNANKFGLAQYEKDIQTNLINKINDNIKTYLISL